MPVAATSTEHAVPQVLDTLSDSTSSTTANDLDLIFLKGIMESPVSAESLEETRLEAVRDNNVELVQDILRELSPFTHHSNTAAELSRILNQPNFQSLLETHDSVASQTCETPPSSPCAFMEPPINSVPVPADAIRMVGIRKVAGEHLGVTFRIENGELVIARILHGGMIDQQGLLHVGDIIKEVNGREVGDDPRVLQEMLQEASGGVVLKILPSYQEPHPLRQILNYWKYQLLEEKRKAFVKKDVVLSPAANLCTGMVGKKKKKMMYLTTKNADFDRHELLIYEEVAKVPPFRRKMLVLIGAPGVGRRSLKNKLLVSDPQHYGTTVPYTSRKPKSADRENMMYALTSRSKMEADIKAGLYLEHGEYDGNLYGTKNDSIHEVVEAGRFCILDVNPQALKVLRTSEFLPYVVFIKAPEFEVLKAMNRSGVEAGVTKHRTDAELNRTVDESGKIQRVYGHYFDLTIVNDDLEQAYRNLKSSLEKLKGAQQWVPVGWVF
ncbi:MAGUK p55 subfamily member 2-like [Sinocyclocheilus anshuiensis]|uniref:MAGUK p55 subfamily member 2-like n=1 Tax=Sinocyclocheilus anshuiensis TaxID=1608454 RepID=UPI0007B958DF|nr:PREDICTED: MAGUK p55 subfamily member 2-like [Sinocyclocheilus anshuiensis]